MAITNHDPARARTLPTGAVFHRCALQVNPHHYGGMYRGQAAKGDVATHARAIVDEALELGISVLAITDHNSVRSVPAFQSATPHINVSVEQLEYAPVSLARIRRLAQVLAGGVYPPGETTAERMQTIEA